MSNITIALAGNPNCGKTTLFNALTGSSQYVGNWPGVTVEKKEGRLKGHKNIIIEDLPGIYSLSPYTLEEVVSRNYLVTDHPSLILNLVDGSNLERNLYLTTQLCELGVPVIIALIAGAFFPENSWVAPGAYFIGVGAIILSGLILKKTAMFSGDPTPFVMELPIYHVPAWKNVIIHAWERCKAFVQKAGTVIFVSSALIWFLSSYNWKVDSVEQNDSMLASIGNVAAPVFQPLGWGEWKPTMATITGLIAKENVVGTFGVLYADGSSGEEAEEEPAETQEMSPAGQELQASLEGASEEAAAEEAAAEEEEDEDAEIRETGDRLVQAGAFTFLSAFSFMIFNLLCAPCFAAMGAIRREMNSAKWTFFAIGYMCALAYCLAFLIYQMGAWLYAEASFGIGQGLAVLLLLGLIYLVVKKPSAPSK